MREVRRSLIKPAEYNPRQISAHGRRGLAKSLTEYGMVETPVWNEKTGNLVGGHQRLVIIDEQMKYDSATATPDYMIVVAVVNLDAKRERKLNLLLNNRAAQGTFERDSLVKMLMDEKIDLEDVHFTRADLEFEIGPIDELFPPARKNQTVEDIAKRAEEMKAKRKAFQQSEDGKADYDSEFYLQVVFDSGEQRMAWLRANGFATDAEYVSFAEMAAAIESGVTTKKGPAAA